MRYLLTGLLATLSLVLSGCGYNTIQTQDEAVKAGVVRSREPISAAR